MIRTIRQYFKILRVFEEYGWYWNRFDKVYSDSWTTVYYTRHYLWLTAKITSEYKYMSDYELHLFLKENGVEWT